MEFSPELSRFQGVIISTDNVHSFSKLISKGGNEEKVEYVIRNMIKFLKEGNYITEKGLVEDKVVMMRKFAFYIILNTDLPVLNKMASMPEINSIIWTIPQIPKYLMCEMFWNLHMETFVFENIVFCGPQLALEVASSFIDHFKYFTPAEGLKKLKMISAACHRFICRLHFFNFENDVMSTMLTFAFINFQQCLNYFSSPPNAGKLLNLSKDDQYKFKGNCLHQMLLLIYQCVEQFTKTEEFAPTGFNELCQLTYQVGSYSEDILGFEICNSPNKAILECLDKCHIALLDKCKDLVMDVSLDIFCAWSEFEDNGKTMQQTIGELCYKLRSKLLNINGISEHPLVSMIEQISHKPVNIQEKINFTDTNNIIDKIRTDNESKAEWLCALVHKDNLCHDAALVEELATNLEVLDEDQCYTLYKVCESHLKYQPENIDIVESLAIKAFKHCNSYAKICILEERFSDNVFVDMKETDEFNSMSTEIFNKVISSPDADLYDILGLFLQNPHKVYTKIFTLATENKQMEIMLKVVKLLGKFSNHYYKHDTEPSVIKIAKNIFENCLDTESKQQNFLSFMCGLKSAGLISDAKLLLMIIMPNLHRALLNRNVCSMNIQCRLLSQAFSVEELSVNRAPMLAMLAQVLDVVRWKIHTFAEHGPSTLEQALQLQMKLFETYDAGIPENEANWLRSKLRNMQPLNHYYYRKLWNPPGNSFIEVVSGMHVDCNMDVEELAMWLSQVICSCSQDEWCYIWESLQAFGDTISLDILHDALSLVTVAEAANRTENSWNCLMYCYRNFVFITRYYFFKEPLTDTQVSSVIVKTASTVNLMKEEAVEEIGTILLPLFSYMIERKSDYTLDLILSMRNHKHSRFTDMVNKIFTNDSTG